MLPLRHVALPLHPTPPTPTGGPSIHDRFTCATAFLRQAADFEKERLRLVQHYDREWRVQEVGGLVASTTFETFGRGLLASLRENPNVGRLDLHLSIADEIRRLRTMREEFLELRDGVSIQFSFEFWALAEELAVALELD